MRDVGRYVRATRAGRGADKRPWRRDERCARYLGRTYVGGKSLLSDQPAFAAMRPRLARHPILYYAAPAILVLIAVLQLYRAHTQHLTPWKGGGFGMFSTADAQGNRILRTYLVTPEGEALALRGTFTPQRARVLAMPDTRTLQQIAREMAATKWAVFTFGESLDALSSLPEDLRLYLARSPAMKRKAEAQVRARALADTDRSDVVPADSARPCCWLTVRESGKSIMNPLLARLSLHGRHCWRARRRRASSGCR